MNKHERNYLTYLFLRMFFVVIVGVTGIAQLKSLLVFFIAMELVLTFFVLLISIRAHSIMSLEIGYNKPGMLVRVGLKLITITIAVYVGFYDISIMMIVQLIMSEYYMGRVSDMVDAGIINCKEDLY